MLLHVVLSFQNFLASSGSAESEWYEAALKVPALPPFAPAPGTVSAARFGGLMPADLPPDVFIHEFQLATRPSRVAYAMQLCTCTILGRCTVYTVSKF